LSRTNEFWYFNNQNSKKKRKIRGLVLFFVPVWFWFWFGFGMFCLMYFVSVLRVEILVDNGLKPVVVKLFLFLLVSFT